jgi:hypothetical protein
MGRKYRVTSDEKEKMTVKLQWLEAVRKLLLSLAVIGREKRGCHGEKKTAWIFFVGLGMVGDGWMVVRPRKRVASQLKVEIGWPVRGRGCW